MSATTSLPGGRLLGRLQNRKSSLNQRLQDLNVRSDEHQNDSEAHSQSSEHFAGQNLKRQNSHRWRNRSDELSRDLDSDDMQSTAVIEFPFGPKNDSASTHNVIRKTLSILQKDHSPGSLLTTPESSRSSRSPSVRSLMLSRPSEIHSPTRELPPLIESDETNPNADLDTISTVTSLGASSYRSGKRGLFQRVRRVDSSADVHDFDVLLTSLRSSPDSRASLAGSHTGLRSTRLSNGIIVAEDLGPEGGLSRGHSGGSRASLPPRAPRPSGISRKLTLHAFYFFFLTPCLPLVTICIRKLKDEYSKNKLCL